MYHITSVMMVWAHYVDPNGTPIQNPSGLTSQHHACKTIQDRELIRHNYVKTAERMGLLYDFVEWEDDEPR